MVFGFCPAGSTQGIISRFSLVSRRTPPRHRCQQTRCGVESRPDGLFDICPFGLIISERVNFRVVCSMSWLKKPSTRHLTIGLGSCQMFIAGCLEFLAGDTAVVDSLQLKSVFLTGAVVFLFGGILYLRHHPESAFKSNNHSNGT